MIGASSAATGGVNKSVKGIYCIRPPNNRHECWRFSQSIRYKKCPVKVNIARLKVGDEGLSEAKSGAFTV